MTHGTLILTSRSVARSIDMRRVIGIVRTAFLAHGKGLVQMPAKIYIHLDKYNGDFRAMPAYIEGTEACGIKWVNVHPGNTRKGLPAVMALIILSDPRTGYPLAIMDGTVVTNVRTGAAGGLAASALAKKGSSRLGLVGAGVQAHHQFLALRELFNVKNVSVYDARPGQAQRLVAKLKRSGTPASLAVSIQACVQEKDIVVTTTPSRKPIVRKEWIAPGTHINAIGADAKGKEELDPALLKTARIFVDDRTQAVHSGEINVPLSKGVIGPAAICGTLGEVLAGKVRGRRSAQEITIFDSTGLAIQDVAVADHIYRTAAAKSRARRIAFYRPS